MVKEPHGEYLPHCPACGSDDFEEIGKCRICGEAIMTDRNMDYPDFCHTCIGVIENELQAILKLFDIFGKRENVIDFIGNWVEAQ